MTILQSERGATAAISAEAARELAADYVIGHLGEFLEPGAPAPDGSRWNVPIYLSVCPRGRLGQVGFVTVDAQTGAILFSDEERANMKARARALAASSSL